MKILIASPIDPATAEHLERTYDVSRAVNAPPDLLTEAIRDRQAVVLRSGVQLTAEVLGHAADMRLLIRAGSGLDNIDVGYARRRGIRVVRVPGMSALPVAEFTFAMMLSLGRKVDTRRSPDPQRATGRSPTWVGRPCAARPSASSVPGTSVAWSARWAMHGACACWAASRPRATR